MNTKFNFLVQFMLVALFALSSVAVSGQFRTDTGSTGSIEEDNGSGDCFERGSIHVDLLFLLPNSTETINLEEIDFGCDLFVQFGSYIQDINAFVPSLVNVDVEGYEGRVGLMYDLTLPVPTYPTSCEGGEAYEMQYFTLDLLCFNGEEYESFNPCDMTSFEFFEYVYEDCSLSYVVRKAVCCDPIIDSGGIHTTDGRSSIENEFSLEIIIQNNGNEIMFRSIGANYTSKYYVVNFSGNLLLEGSLEVEGGKWEKLNLSKLKSGFYVFSILDKFDDLVSKKIIKL